LTEPRLASGGQPAWIVPLPSAHLGTASMAWRDGYHGGMNGATTLRSLAAALLLAGTGLSLPSGAASPPENPPRTTTEGVGWWEIELTARKFLLSAESSLRVEHVSSREAQEKLAEAPAPPAPEPSGPEVDRVTVSSVLPFGRRERVVTWLDTLSGRALQTEKTRTGSKPYWKLQRYHGQTYTEWRAAPADRTEEGGDPRSWDDRRKEVISCAGRVPPGQVITDSYALLYRVAAAHLDQPGRDLVLTLCSHRHLVEVRFRPGRIETEKVSFEESWPGGHRQRRGRIQVRTVLGTARWLTKHAPGTEPETGLMGMRGPLEILIEKGTDLPVEVRGHAPGIGRLVVRLKRVIWRQPPS